MHSENRSLQPAKERRRRELVWVHDSSVDGARWGQQFVGARSGLLGIHFHCHEAVVRFLPVLASQLQLVRIGSHFLVPDKAGLLVVEWLNLQMTPRGVQTFYKTPLRMLNLPKTLPIGCVTEQRHPSRGEFRQFESGKCPLWGERANPLTPRTNPGVNGTNQAFYAFFLKLVFHVLPKLWNKTNQISSVF